VSIALNTAKRNVADTFLNTMKSNVAAMFLSTTVKHAANTAQNTTVSISASHAKNGFATRNATMYHVTTTNTLAKTHVLLLAANSALKHV
jgi:hypothetical protein